MAFIGIKCPPETARILSEINVGDSVDKEPPSSFHTTMIYLGKEVPIGKIAQSIPIVFSVVSQTKPFTLATSRATTFPPNPDDGVPVIALIDSNELHDFRQALCDAFDKAKFAYNKKYPTYQPHVTLGYSQDPLTHADIQFPTVEWGAHELSLWGGDDGDKRLIVTFPLSVADPKIKTASASSSRSREALNRAFVQLVNNWSLKA